MKIPDESERCSEQVWEGFHHVQCLHKFKVERNGKKYCGRHDPLRVERRRKIANLEWDIKDLVRNVRDAEHDAQWKIREIKISLAETALLVGNWTAVETFRQRIAQVHKDLAKLKAEKNAESEQKQAELKALKEAKIDD